MTASPRRSSGVRCSGRTILCAACLFVLTAMPAAAQSTGNDAGASPDSSGRPHRHHRGQGGGQHQAALPDVKGTPDPWPRLDPGAVFCRTSADLQQHLAVIAARLDHSSNPGAEPAGCSVIAKATPVVVVARTGMAQTEVRLSSAAGAAGPGETGWTDAFLPDRAP